MITTNTNFDNANLPLVKKPIHLITITGYSRVFTNRSTGVGGQYDWVTNIEDHSITVNDLDGGSDLGEFTLSVLDYQRLLTADFPGFTFEGKKVTIKTGFIGMSQVDFVTIFTGIVDRVESVEKNSAYRFICTDNKSILTKVIYDVADDGYPTSSEHRKTLNAHPLDLLMSIFADCGLTTSDYDQTKIIDYRDGIFSGTQFQFTIDSPPQAREFIEQQLLKPLGGYLWTKADGKLSVNFIYTTDQVAVFDLTEANVTEIPEAEQADLVNVMSFRFDKSDDDGKYKAEAIQQYAESIALYGQYGQEIVESDGMRSGLQGFFLSSLVSRIIFQRYGLKNFRFESIPAFWTAVKLEPGDVVTLTHSKVPDRKLGVMGVTGRKFVVLDRTWNFQDALVQLTLVDASYFSNFGLYKITPDAQGTYIASSSADKAKYMFLCNDSDQYSNGDAGHLLG